MCSLDVVDPFGFLGHVVAGRNGVRWSALSDKPLSSTGLISSLLSISPLPGAPLLSVCLSVCTPPPHRTDHMHALPAHGTCVWRG